MEQSPDEEEASDSGKAKPTATKNPEHGGKGSLPTQSDRTTLASDQEQAIVVPSKLPGRTSDGSQAATPTRQPNAGKASAGAGSGGATVTVTIYADAPSPTDTDTATPIKYQGEMHAWNVSNEEEAAEDEPSAVAPGPSGTEQDPCDSTETGAPDDGDASVNASTDASKISGNPPEETPSTGDPESTSSVRQVAGLFTEASATNNGTPAETPGVSDPEETSSSQGGGRSGRKQGSATPSDEAGGYSGKKQGSPLEQPCPMDTEGSEDTSDVWEGTGEETVEPSDMDPDAADSETTINNVMLVKPEETSQKAPFVLDAEDQSLKAVTSSPGATPGSARGKSAKEFAWIEEPKQDNSKGDSKSSDTARTAVQPPDSQPFDMSHCILKFDAATGEYALDKRRSRIRARARTGQNGESNLGTAPAGTELPPCATYTLQK